MQTKMDVDTAVIDTVNSLCEEVEVRAFRYDLPERVAVIAWDTETTGLNGVIVQLGVVMLDSERNEVFSNARILAPIPEFPIEEMAYHVHKITRHRQQVEGEPVLQCIRAFEELSRKARERRIPMVAHNASFDKRMLRNTAKAISRHVEEPETRCTMVLGKRLIKSSEGKRKCLKNKDVYERLIGEAPEESKLHDAVEDARLTAHSFLVGRARGMWE